jgi:hypothetical protein
MEVFTRQLPLICRYIIDDDDDLESRGTAGVNIDSL